MWLQFHVLATRCRCLHWTRSWRWHFGRLAPVTEELTEIAKGSQCRMSSFPFLVKSSCWPQGGAGRGHVTSVVKLAPIKQAKQWKLQFTVFTLWPSQLFQCGDSFVNLVQKLLFLNNLIKRYKSIQIPKFTNFQKYLTKVGSLKCNAVLTQASTHSSHVRI